MNLDNVQQLIREECDRIRDMLIAKNEAYGNSALDPVRVFSRASPREQILVRLDDKLSRLSRGEAAGEDVTADLIGYLVLLRVLDRAGGELPPQAPPPSPTLVSARAALCHALSPNGPPHDCLKAKGHSGEHRGAYGAWADRGSDYSDCCGYEHIGASGATLVCARTPGHNGPHCALEMLIDEVERPLGASGAACQCSSVYESEGGLNLRCERKEGHPGNHSNGSKGWADKCGTINPLNCVQCELVEGHKGNHQSLIGGTWSRHVCGSPHPLDHRRKCERVDHLEGTHHYDSEGTWR